MHTPSLSVIDPRGLAVRAVAYCRLATDKPITARVTHQVFDSLGLLVEQRDPRLFALNQNNVSVPANLTTIHNLTGQALCSDSVDAGWQLGLPGAAAQALESWDQRGWHRRTEHDSLLRPVSVREQVLGEPERCVERMTFGGVADDHARHNRCGQPIRQDDPAGSRMMADYGLSAAVLHERRHFLNSFDPVDWPALDTDRDHLLEPGDGAQTLWRYAPTGEVTVQTDAKGHAQHSAHDRAGQLRSVGLQRFGQSRADTLVSAIHYSASGQVEHELAGNGMRTTSAYDPANGHLILLATLGPDQRFLQKLTYRYDPVGNITEIADAALPIQHFANQRIEPLRRFTYDTLYQLISATGWESAKPSLGPALPEWQAYGPPDGSRWCNYSEIYDYDEAGNLLQRTHQGAVGDTLSMRVAALSNRSVRVHSTPSGVDDSFDARGNLLELQPGQGLQWNGRNQLARVIQVARVDGADDLERYVYDSEGTRLRKIRTSAAKSIVHTAEVRYLPGLELHSNSATGEQLQVVSIPAGRCTVRMLYWDSPPPTELENDQLRYCFDDHLGSSVFEVDAQAQVISQEVYYPFGGTAWLAGRQEVETGYKTIRYSGKERDATGLYYYGARYYAPWLQRWLNPDPAGDVDGINFYNFVKNAPNNFVDVDGRSAFFANISDFLIERRAKVHHIVEQRGMKNIKKRFPGFESALTKSIGDAKTILNNTMSALDSGEYDKGLDKVFFGVANREHLIKFYGGMLLNLERIANNLENVVLFDGSKETQAKAFVLFGDRKGKIYFNSGYVETFSAGELTETVLHEVSHMRQKNMPDIEVLDYWYLDSSLLGGTSEIDWPEEKGKSLEYLGLVASMNKSERMMAGNNIGLSDFGGGVLDNNLLEVARFKVNQLFRTKLSMLNADSYTYFAIALGGPLGGSVGGAVVEGRHRSNSSAHLW
ncbi:RHS repeat-associated core domain-containing protein [Pseudomonas laurylsulfativorans]|uniref:RHS repeat-associated core domain-containing protein n=1 Tax=Pseudomonas laurylsulfativorans TaxID=1943631 RepID=UPI0020A110B2